MTPNPYGCFGQTDSPHKSSHVAGSVNVVARTTCAVPVPEIVVGTILEKQTCVVFCWWSAVGGSGLDRRYNTSWAKTNSAATPCVSGKYRGNSFHIVRGADGKIYETVTSKTATITC